MNCSTVTVRFIAWLGLTCPYADKDNKWASERRPWSEIVCRAIANLTGVQCSAVNKLESGAAVGQKEEKEVNNDEMKRHEDHREFSDSR